MTSPGTIFTAVQHALLPYMIELRELDKLDEYDLPVLD